MFIYKIIIILVALSEKIEEEYSCEKCWEGCDVCDGPGSCMAQFSWTQRYKL